MPERDMSIEQLQQAIMRERKIIAEMTSYFNHLKNAQNQQESDMVASQIYILKDELKKAGREVTDTIGRIFMFAPLVKEEKEFEEYEPKKAVLVTDHREQMPPIMHKPGKRMKLDALEKHTISRMKKKTKKVIKVRERKPSRYVKMASSLFHNYSTHLINKGHFKDLSRDLIKSDMEFIPVAYVSVIFFTTLVSFFAAIIVATFFLFFNVTALPPFLTFMEESLLIRFFKVVWLLVFIPVVTGVFAYYYPTLEKRAIEGKINEELPFAVVHMSSISSSMIEPSKIFTIMISTHEYPAVEKEFIKIQNEINVYGYDLVTALRNRSFNSPSKKLAELFNGLATTITSGGDLPGFFDKRSQTLLFDHRLEKEKQSKASETFMDIYISAVVAAPMILMLILMMMRISGLGVSLSTGMISLIVILGVSFINIVFLAFLHLKHPEGA